MVQKPGENKDQNPGLSTCFACGTPDKEGAGPNVPDHSESTAATLRNALLPLAWHRSLFSIHIQLPRALIRLTVEGDGTKPRSELGQGNAAQT